MRNNGIAAHAIKLAISDIRYGWYIVLIKESDVINLLITPAVDIIPLNVVAKEYP